MSRPDPIAFRSLFEPVKQIAILLGKGALYDHVASALALKLSLEELDKQVNVLSPDQMTVEFNRLVGIESVGSNFGSKNVVVSFPGQSEYVDKVSYNIDKGELQLIITPKPGTPGVDPHKVKFISSAASADLVIIIGAKQLTDLGELYLKSRDFLDAASPLWIHEEMDIESACVSETIIRLIELAKMPVSQDCASNLLAGLAKGTGEFKSPRVTEQTFTAAAFVVKNGAKSHQVYAPDVEVPGSLPSDWGQSVYQGNTLS
jgi:hypothetical protein